MKKIIPCALIAIFAALFAFNVINKKEDPKTEDPPLLSLSERAENLELGSFGAVSVYFGENGSQQILFSKNPDEKLPISSITKLMTSLVAYKKNNGTRDLNDLLKRSLVISDNDAADKLSKIAYEDFIMAMNTEAQNLKMANTIFYNAVGLDPADGGLEINQSTANDLVKLLDYIYKNYPELFAIIGEKEYNGKPNTNELLFNYSWPIKILGSKTGETPKGKQSLIILTEAPGNSGYIISAILHSENRQEDMAKLIDWALSSYDWPGMGKMYKWKKLSDTPWQNRDAHSLINFKGKIFMMGGLNGNGHIMEDGSVYYWDAEHFSDLWASENGNDWKLVTNEAPWGQRRSIQPVEFNGKLWAFGGWQRDGGYNNKIFFSEDGYNWQTATSSSFWGAREGHSVAEYNGKLYMAGGVAFDIRETKNDVWTSEDGLNWRKILDNSPWSKRYDHAITSFNGKLWLTGGLDFGENIKRDIWSSEDGSNWKLEKEIAPWPARHGHIALVYDNKLWVFGGWGKTGGMNDVWFSNNGLDWEKLPNETPWMGREDHAGAVFNGKVVITGGMDKNFFWQNDVWQFSSVGIK